MNIQVQLYEGPGGCSFSRQLVYTESRYKRAKHKVREENERNPSAAAEVDGEFGVEWRDLVLQVDTKLR